MIQIDISERDNVVTVSITGEISSLTAKEFDSAFQEYNIAECKVLALDLKKLPYLDSFGISRLVKLSQLMKEKNVEFILINLNDHIRQIFHMGTFDRLFNIMTGDEFEAAYFPAESPAINNVTRTIKRKSEMKNTRTVQYKYDDKSGTTLLFEEEEIKSKGE